MKHCFGEIVQVIYHGYQMMHVSLHGISLQKYFSSHCLILQKSLCAQLNMNILNYQCLVIYPERRHHSTSPFNSCCNAGPTNVHHIYSSSLQ